MQPLKSIFGFLLIFYASFVNAASYTGLYQIKIAVGNPEQQTQQQYLQQALELMLQRASGNAADLTTPEIKAALEQPGAYVKHYNLLNATNQQPTVLVQFSPAAIKSLLLSAKQPVWGDNRPGTVMWVAIAEPQGRTVISEASDLAAVVQQTAQQFGIPLILPLFDLADTDKVNIADIWGQFTEVLLPASERYGTDAMLVGRIYPAYAGNWQADWAVLHQGEEKKWHDTGDNQQQLLTAAMQKIGKDFAALYAVSSDEASEEFKISIKNINSATDYADVEDYLRRLAPIKDLMISEISAGEVVFIVKPVGSSKAVVQAMELGKKLQPKTASAATSGRAQFSYTWVQ